MRIGKTIWIVLFSFFLYPVFAEGQNPKQYFKAGDEFLETKNYIDAIDQYTKAIEMDPDYTKAYLARAGAYEQIDSIRQAAYDYKRASVFLAKDDEVFYHAGRLFNEVGEYQEALYMLDKATSLSKRNKPAFTEKAAAFLAIQQYENSLVVSDSAIKLDKSAVNYYQHGLAAFHLGNQALAESDFTEAINTNPGFLDAYIARARVYLKDLKVDDAMRDVTTVIQKDDKNVEAYLIRSQIYVERLEYPNAINDISRILLVEPENPEMYIIRGKYYQDFNQHPNAINDFSKAIMYSQDDPEAYFLRARSYEEILDYKNAANDYGTIGILSKYNGEAMKLKDEAEARLYEINRETDDPQIMLMEPALNAEEYLELPLDKEEVIIKGKIEEQSNIEALSINGTDIRNFEKKEDYYVFLASVPVTGVESLQIVARDIYNNESKKTFSIKRTEITPPTIQILAPYASDNGEVVLENDEPYLYVEGRVSDESLIRSIMVEGRTASYDPQELNPVFSVPRISIVNKNSFNVEVEDIYGNKSAQSFHINREWVITQENPMGKTWVVFIQNSRYETFASLEGPVNDISLMKGALANYQINKIIVKENMSKEEMEKFFSIELRDLVRSNQVNSLMIWYAGHGKFVNDVGYWIPVDAERDDEFTYFNINTLKASLQTYTKYITHTLVVTDACESGPTFYQAMRGVRERSCDNYEDTQSKSSQVFSSAGYEEASDNSQFTRTFANALVNNPNACIPIENIVSQVRVAVIRNNQQEPRFGKITGLEDANGTFFFIAK